LDQQLHPMLFKRDLASVIHALAASRLDSISAEYLGMKPSVCRMFQLTESHSTVPQ